MTDWSKCLSLPTWSTGTMVPNSPLTVEGQCGILAANFIHRILQSFKCSWILCIECVHLRVGSVDLWLHTSICVLFSFGYMAGIEYAWLTNMVHFHQCKQLRKLREEVARMACEEVGLGVGMMFTSEGPRWPACTGVKNCLLFTSREL